MELNWILDPAHGWLVVPLDELQSLGIVDRISRYSYLKDGVAYLEEDCDASVYLQALYAKGFDPEDFSSTCRSLNNDAPCRNYPTFRA
jgi:hypothetical protein